MDVVSPTNAQVRPNAHSRRTTYRTHPKMAIPVAAPMSPVGDDLKSVRSGCQSPADTSVASSIASCSSSSYLPMQFNLSSHQQPQLRPLQPKIYESLKSQFSTSGSSSEDGSSVAAMAKGMMNSDSYSDASSSGRRLTKYEQR